MELTRCAIACLCLLAVAGGVLAVDFQQFSDVPRGTGLQGTPAGPGEPGVVHDRALTYYTDRAAWFADPLMSGITTTLEDFTGTLVPPNSVLACPAPFNSSTNNSCFAPGAIADGVSVDVIDTGGGGTDGVVLTPPFLGVDCVAVGPNTFTNNGVLDFSPPVRGVGLDLLAPFGPVPFGINIYGPGSVLLGSTTATGQLTSVGAFWGVVSDDVIGIARLEFFSAAGDGELFCNVEWGGPPVPVELQSISIE